MTDTKHSSGAPWRNFYGRFRGKTIRASQHDYLDNDLLPLSPGPIDWDVNPDRDQIDLADYFGQSNRPDQSGHDQGSRPSQSGQVITAKDRYRDNRADWREWSCRENGRKNCATGRLMNALYRS